MPALALARESHDACNGLTRSTIVEERILFGKAHKSCRAILGCRIRTSTLRKVAVFEARAAQEPREAIVSFQATWLVIDPVLLVALLGELLANRPGTSPHRRIFNGHHVFERGWAGPRPAFDQMQVLARTPIIGFRAEVRHVDDERISLPVTARVAIPLADASRQMRAPVHDDVALPTLSLTHVIEHRDAAGRLHDSTKASAECGSKFGQSARQTALRQTAVLRTVIAVHAYGIVARWQIGVPRRGRRVILSAVTSRRFALARFGRLQQGETEFPVGGSSGASLWQQWRKPAIGWVDNQRGTLTDTLVGQEYCVVVRTRDVELCSGLCGPLFAVELRPLFIDFVPLRFGEKFLVRKPWGALEGCIKFGRPNTL